MRRIALLAALAVAMPTIGQQTGSTGVGVPGVGPATTGTSPPPTTVLPGTQTGVRGSVSPTTTTDPTGATTSVGATGSSTIVKGTAGEGRKDEAQIRRLLEQARAIKWQAVIPALEAALAL